MRTFVFGLCVGIIWTLLFGPALDRIAQYKRNWYAYGVEAIGVFVMSVYLESANNLSAIQLLACMIAAGVGMFVVKLLTGDFSK